MSFLQYLLHCKRSCYLRLVAVMRLMTCVHSFFNWILWCLRNYVSTSYLSSRMGRSEEKFVSTIWVIMLKEGPSSELSTAISVKFFSWMYLVVHMLTLETDLFLPLYYIVGSCKRPIRLLVSRPCSRWSFKINWNFEYSQSKFYCVHIILRDCSPVWRTYWEIITLLTK